MELRFIERSEYTTHVGSSPVVVKILQYRKIESSVIIDRKLVHNWSEWKDVPLYEPYHELYAMQGK